MFKIKCAYHIKLFAITVLAVTLLMLVEIAPEFPIAFTVGALIFIICIWLLWVSTLKDEYRLNSAKLTFQYPKRRTKENPRKAA